MNSTKNVISNDKVTVDLPVSTASGEKLAMVVENGKLALAKISPSGYFNGNRMITRNGFPHFNPGTSTISEFLDKVFYPSVPPSVNVSVTGAVREYGNPAGTTLSFDVTQHSSSVNSITLNGVPFVFTPTSGDGVTYSNTNLVTLSVNETNTFTVVALTDGLERVEASVSVVYQHARFAFLSAVDLFTMNDADVSTYIQQAASGELTIGKQQSIGFTANNEFINFAYLSAYGLPSFTVNGLSNTDFKVKTFDYTNQFGFTASYYLVRTGSKLVGNYAYNIN